MNEIPKPESRWQHRNGCYYTVLFLTNAENENSDYPVTVVYRGDNGNLWSRPLLPTKDVRGWHDSMTEIR